MEACVGKRVRLEKGMGSLVDEDDRGAGRCPSCLQNRGWRREAAVGEEKKSKGAVLFVFGWEEDQRTGGVSSWWNQPGEKKKNQSWGPAVQLREQRRKKIQGRGAAVLG